LHRGGDNRYVEEYLQNLRLRRSDHAQGLLIGAVTIALSVVPLAYALLTQHGVKTTRLYERYPAGGL
jgi:hypothetical protein